jgi:hypothetical protein
MALNRSALPDARPDYAHLAIPETTDPASFALAPDGRRVVFVALLYGHNCGRSSIQRRKSNDCTTSS